MPPEMTNGAERRRFGASADAPEPSLAELVGAALDDVQELFVQQFDYFREEVAVDLERTREAGFSIGMVGVFSLLGGVLALPAVVGLLAWWIPEIAWWGWCGILALLCFVIAALASVEAWSRLHAFSLWPRRSLRTFKENFRWIRKHMSSTAS